jgi:hypothetical protein
MFLQLTLAFSGSVVPFAGFRINKNLWRRKHRNEWERDGWSGGGGDAFRVYIGPADQRPFIIRTTRATVFTDTRTNIGGTAGIIDTTTIGN